MKAEISGQVHKREVKEQQRKDNSGSFLVRRMYLLQEDETQLTRVDFSEEQSKVFDSLSNGDHVSLEVTVSAWSGKSGAGLNVRCVKLLPPVVAKIA
ncbi:MAG: hypothetical protein ACYDDH_12025 [Candidatus Desulforudaceae bacterium]